MRMLALLFSGIVLAQSSPDQFYRDGIAAYNDGNYKEAIELLQQAARRDPNVPDFRYHLGLAYLKAGEPKKAASEFEATLARTGMERSTRLKEPEILAMAGLAYFDMGRNDLARKRLELALSRQEDLTDANFTLGVIELAEGNGEEGLARLHAVVDKRPRHAAAHLAMASELERAGEIEHALEHLDFASEASPRDLSIRISYGRLAYSAGLIEDAELAFASILDVSKKTGNGSVDSKIVSDAGFNLGTIKLQRGAFEDAAATLRMVVAQAPEREDARFNLADALRRSKKFEDAERELQVLLAGNADYPGAAFSLALVFEGLEQWDQAEKAYRQSLATQSNFVPAYLNLAALLEKGERLPEAVELLEQCLTLELDDGQRQQLNQVLETLKAAA